MDDSMKTKRRSRQWRVYTFVCNYVRNTGRFPNNRIISAALGINSTSTVRRYLLQLAEDGLLDTHSYGRRGQNTRFSVAGQQIILPAAAAEAASEWKSQYEMLRQESSR